MATKKIVKKQGFLKRMFSGQSYEKKQKVMGIFFVFIGLFLAASLISYLFTWKIDQDKLIGQGWSMLFDPALEMSNLFGRLGAFVSHKMIYNGIGISSIVFCVYFVWIGLRMINSNQIPPPGKFIRHSLLLAFFASAFTGFAFFNFGFNFGGNVGHQISLWLTAFIGNFGTAALLTSALLGILVWYFNPTVNFEAWVAHIKNMIPKKRTEKTVLSTAGVGVAAEEEESVIIPQKQYYDLKEVEEEFDNEISLEIDEEPIQEEQEIEQEHEVGRELQLQLDDIFTIENTKKEDEDQAIDACELELEIPATGGEETKSVLAIEKENIDKYEPYDPTSDLSNYVHPPLELLVEQTDNDIEVDKAELENNKDQIITTLLNYKIEITKIRATIGPTVTLYEIVPAPGVRISKIKNLEDDIALSLSALGIRIIAPIPGKGTIGIEVPNKKKQVVGLREVLDSDKFKHAKMDLPIALGKTISNEVFVADLAKMPHMLIAGATGQGKSVGINTILMSILYKKHPSQVKLVLVDPKKVELFPYSQIDKHFLAALPDQTEPIITETKKVINTLNSLCIEMDQRYELLKVAKTRNIKEYNQKFQDRQLNPNNGHKFLPFIVLVVDEFADLIMTAGKEVELPIARLAQLARAVGIHLIIATQRPSVNIITGVIKANFPARVGFKVTSKIDSRTILDAGGADQLIGRGDMLLSVGSDMVRIQCAFIDTPEVEAVLKHIHDQRGYTEPYLLPEYIDPNDSSTGSMDTIKASELDEHFDDAARLVVQSQHGSTSMIQRRIKLGYNRAGRIMDQLEHFGIVGPNEGSKSREVLIQSEMELEEHLSMIHSTK